MVDLKWIILDDVEHYLFETDYRDDYPLIEGNYLLTLNDRECGSVFIDPQDFYSFSLHYDLQHMFLMIREKVVTLGNHDSVCIQGLSENLVEYVLSRNGKLLDVSLRFIGTGEVLWTEVVDFKEARDVCVDALEKYRKEVIRRNPLMAENRYIKELEMKSNSSIWFVIAVIWIVESLTYFLWIHNPTLGIMYLTPGITSLITAVVRHSEEKSPSESNGPAKKR